MNGHKLLMVLGFFAAIGNMGFSLVKGNYGETIAWLVALLWFPYKSVFVNKGDNHE